MVSSWFTFALAGLVQHLKPLFLMLGMIRLQLIFAVGKVFGAGLCWMYMALCSSLILLMSGKEIGRCFGVSWLGGVWEGFLLGRVREQPVPCRFCAPDGDGHLFWACTFPPLVENRESPEFHDLMSEERAHWPRCLLWHGWLPMLSGVNGASPWAADASESAGYLVEVALGRYSSDLLAQWGPSDEYDEVAGSSQCLDWWPCPGSGHWCLFFRCCFFLLTQLRIAGVVVCWVISP